MNLKERGITVGDLLLLLIFVISMIFIFNKVKGNDKENFSQQAPKEFLFIERS